MRTSVVSDRGDGGRVENCFIRSPKACMFDGAKREP